VSVFSVFFSRDQSRIFAVILCIVWDTRTLNTTVKNMTEFEPYSFEPMRDFSDSDGENTADGQNEFARRGNTNWCYCEHCENWEISRRESVFAAKRLTKP